MLRAFPAPKDRSVEWACQEPLERRVCLESPARRASLAYLERKEPKERKGRRVSLALGFRDGPGTRETKGWQAFRELLERRARREVLGSRACPAPQAPKACRGAWAIQEALGCLEKKVIKASQGWTASLVSKEKQVFLGSLAPRAQPARKGSLAVMESRGQQERRVNQVYPEEDSQGFQGPKERKVQRVTWVSQDWLGVQEYLDPKESRGSWDLRGHKDSQDCLELRATLWRGPKETGAHRDNLACQAFRDPWGRRGSPGLMD